MADTHTRIQRSRNMAAVKSKDTEPEVRVRKMLYRLGYRYRLHVSNLPGKPDIVFSGRQKAIFVHGCYWHMHKCIKGRSTPATNAEFWSQKRHDNVRRDMRNARDLKNLGWDVLTLWECEIAKTDLDKTLTLFLNRERNK